MVTKHLRVIHMDTYDSRMAPSDSSPEIPGSERPEKKKSGYTGDCKMRLIIVAVAVALVSIGATALLTSNKEVTSQSCDDKLDTLTKQAITDKQAMKAKLDELREDLAAAERAALGLPEIEGTEDVTRFEGTDFALYVNKQYRFAFPFQENMEVEAATCESDASGEPQLSAGAVPAVVLENAEQKSFYIVPGYHYEAIDGNDTMGCRKIVHDLNWLADNTFGTSLMLSESLENVEAVRAYLQTYGERCGELAEFNLLAGTEESPLMYQVVLAPGEVVGDVPECFYSGGIDMWYSPSSQTLYTVPIGNELDHNIQYPKQLLAL